MGGLHATLQAAFDNEVPRSRVAFRDWCGETGVDFAVSRNCLAHTVDSQVTKANARSSPYNRRVQVMQEWADSLDPSSSPRDA